ncbi:alpha-N-acetylglucosaminidase N-terminal domain-containing protein [Amycolatopsis anabasis]|uniref:alpha-N-acetylglucosaminidase N-terminal domain-containing protein n=1 Tax=Amycolatopsis anabasis TaxID=1840409 RepID=UPI001C551AD5|nr:alpha-N-acetylglucosaminidase N-terminal domain-containing protein [Amycolatopsis anabasis]
MKRAITLLLAGLLVAPAVPAAAEPAIDSAAAPAYAAVKRLLPNHYRQFELVVRPGADAFRVSGTTGRVRVEGNTPGTVLTGVEQYLQQITHTDLGWPGRAFRGCPAACPRVRCGRPRWCRTGSC